MLGRSYIKSKDSPKWQLIIDSASESSKKCDFVEGSLFIEQYFQAKNDSAMIFKFGPPETGKWRIHCNSNALLPLKNVEHSS